MRLTHWRRVLTYTPLLIVLALPGVSMAQATFLPAFPGAEGAAAYVSGGRGGDVYHVTNLKDSGPGSLRHGLYSATGPRTIVFDASGVIKLRSNLFVTSDNLTIAGQTAPGMGICVINYGLDVAAKNVIVRHIRVRPGDACMGPAEEQLFNGDAINLSGTNIIVDHCSASWAVDENISAVGIATVNIITVQYCINAECLHHTGIYHGEVKEAASHSMGSLLKPYDGDGAMSVHHNLYAGNNNRNPAVGTYHGNQTLNINFYNNVIYNCRQNGYSSGESLAVRMDYVGNYVIAGPATAKKYLERAFTANAKNKVSIHQSGNRVDGNCNGVPDGVDTGWDMFAGEYARSERQLANLGGVRVTADRAYEQVLDQAGAMPWNRDQVDARVISELIAGTGTIVDSQRTVGGYPKIEEVHRPKDFDTDGDGMPDEWERAHGLNPNVADNNGDADGDGYTNLENYIFSIGASN